jgi:O-methyltransferase
MMSKGQIGHILRNLRIVLEANIEGDIVELGCHAGSSSLFIRRMLDYHGSDKAFHVYDSWQGLPLRKDERDGSECSKQGACKTARENFERSFAKWDLTLPQIHDGWFAEIPDEEYPAKICFAFFDGDLYQSIIDSFNKVYCKLSPHARLLIDDYEHPEFIGCQRACQDFLKDKSETVEILKDDSGRASLGLIIKA